MKRIPAALTRGKVANIPVDMPRSCAARGLGPRAALQRAGLQELPALDRRLWVEETRIACLLGNSTATRKSLKSGVSCYIAFVGMSLLTHSGSDHVPFSRVQTLACLDASSIYPQQWIC